MDKTRIPTNINWVVLLRWLWIRRASEVFLAFSSCPLNQWEALHIGHSLQLKLRDGSRNAATNHLMLRLPENNLSSSPSVWCYWLVLAAFAPHPSLILDVSSTDTAHNSSACHLKRLVFIVRGSVIPSPSSHVWRSGFKHSMAFAGSYLVRCKAGFWSDRHAITVLRGSGCHPSSQPSLKQEAALPLMLCAYNILCTTTNKKSEINLLIMDVLLTETHPTST